ncbi:unnamed protein product [Clonostachys rhizophaga]|uniref:Uncharacterized protein n=1 Tax=Clonostachys rhizophaga TaxID=160324 RepID=A0A9N9VFU0_9HYPO|nr:unnamed protein product [Clonostachys rhizophaga]
MLTKALCAEKKAREKNTQNTKILVSSFPLQGPDTILFSNFVHGTFKELNALEDLLGAGLLGEIKIPVIAVTRVGKTFPKAGFQDP